MDNRLCVKYYTGPKLDVFSREKLEGVIKGFL